MKKLLLSLSISLFTISLITACTSNRPSAKEKLAVYENFLTENKIQSLKKITSFHYQGWRSLDNLHLIISTSPKKSYLVTLTNDCYDLSYATRIAIKQTTSSTLQTRFDSILVPDSPHIKCYIKSLHPLTRVQVEALEKLVKNPS